ncbi:MAG TPA: A/G-specific adenine glycosylase [Anaeromyxobacter sp.]|nr:A/G-specific adenine glycosylase [Anaeromyxobacter sp.]
MPSAAPRRPAAAQAQRFGPRRTRALRRRLLAWWDAGHRKLPWRYPQRAADPYRVWLAEVMLQQTRVSVVIPYYERFVARYPTLEALAAAREDDVLALWGGLGYYARGRNLAAAAREAVARYGGLPASVERLRTLPGFGPYTAGAVASIAFAIPAPAVDGNAARVLARLAAVQGATSDAGFRARVGALAAELVDPDRPGDLNQALMELGATACAPRGPSCRRCPVAALCAARAAGTAAEIPAPRRRPERPAMELACAVARRNGSILLARRPARGLFAGLWTPPSAELGPGDDARAALARAVGRRLAVGEELATCERILTHRALTLRAFACEVRGAIAVGAGLRWVPMDELESVGMPSAFLALLARV